MKLRSMYLSLLECRSASKEQKGRLSFENRCLCNFVQRAARSWKIPTEGFNNVVVKLVDAVDEAPPQLQEVKSLTVPVAADLERYEQSSGADRHEFLIACLTEGLRRADAFHPIALDRLLERIEEFRAGGYRNEWVHQTKRLRLPAGIPGPLQATLHCAMTLERFTLTLRLQRRDETLFDEVVLDSLPDEICFHYKFEDIVVRDDQLVVTTRGYFGEELVRLPLTRFAS